MPPGRLVPSVLFVTLLPLLAPPAQAWIFHEHRAITYAAVSGLADDEAEDFAKLWESARAGREERFCAEPGELPQEGIPSCLDFTPWPAIGGDHSCSSRELLATVSDTEWILGIVAIGARTGRELAAATNERQRDSAHVRGTLDLARTDPAPGVRGAANNGHFAPNRQTNDLREFIDSAVREGAPLNATGIYARNHLAALRLAAAWGSSGLAGEERSGLARAALSREAFGLHFLEDSFAAGHVAGCWGDAAERMGTHDYYNAHGLETMTWEGENVVLLGDRRLREVDRDRAASAVRASLSQLLEAARPDSALAGAVQSLSLEQAWEDPPFSVCTEIVFPEGGVPESLEPMLREVVARAPMPGRGPGLGALPRYRADLGGFVSWVSGFRVGVLDGQFEESFDGTFVDGEISLGLRFGVGLDALTGRSGDGLMFLEVGVANRQEKGPYFTSQNPTETLPGRTGLQLRLRSPFWLIPGDLIVAGPVLALTSHQTLKSMAIVAANGGVIPWQRPMPLGEQKRFQFVLGREVGLTLHGQWGADHYMMALQPSPGAPEGIYEVEVRSREWEFPILEYRAFHTFAGRQSYTAILQVGAGFDQPTDAQVIGLPDARVPDLRTRDFIFMRVTFDVRRYF